MLEIARRLRRPLALLTGLSLTLVAHRANAQTANAEPTEIAPVAVHARSLVEIHFLAYRADDQYTVRVHDDRCNTPCTLVLPSGPSTVHATGAGDIDQQFVVPHLSAQFRLSHGAPSWYLPLGAVFIPAGIVIGGGLWALGLACGYGSGAGGCQVANFVGWPLLGIGMLISGSVLVSIANHGPAPDANRIEILDARARPHVRLTDIALAPMASGVSAGVGFAF